MSGEQGPRIGRVPPAPMPPLVNQMAVRVDLDPFLSLRALASYSGLSVRTLRSLLVDPVHPLACYRIGGRVLVRRSDYDSWAARYRHVGDANLDQVVSKALKELRGTEAA